MLYSCEYFMPIICVISRGLLQNFDRYIVGIKGQDINFQQFVNTLSPLLIGGSISLFFCSFSDIFLMFLRPYCFFSAVLMHLVSYAFYRSFKLWNVREVVIASKLTDLLLAPALCFVMTSFFSGNPLFESFNSLAYIVGLCSFFPLLINVQKIDFIWHPTSLLLIASMCIQMLYTGFFKENLLAGWIDAWEFTLGMLMWRGIFSIFQMTLSNRLVNFFNENGNVTWSMLGTILTRSGLMLIAYFTFVLSIELDKPMIIFPILNCAPIVSVMLAKFILKEELSAVELIALVGLTSSSLL